MLSRVAENIFWMQKYRERAENMARLIDVSFNLNIEIPNGQHQWLPLLQVFGAQESFSKYYKVIDMNSVLHFLTFDTRNPISIFSCLSMSRENARSVREIITSDMWHELNILYIFLQQSNNRIDNHHAFYTRIKRQCQLFTGISDTTLSHGLAWHFGRVGYLLERADMTSRLLDIKYFTLLPSPDFIGSPFDNIQWNALLNSMSALEMYRQKWHFIKPANVVEFLVLDKEFPRSIFSCIVRAKESLQAIMNTTRNANANKPFEIIMAIIEKLDGMNGESIVNYGLHEFLDELQKEFIAVNDGISEVYFSFKELVNQA
jgi:uncharacterized alpha-E superfamily protein